MALRVLLPSLPSHSNIDNPSAQADDLIPLQRAIAVSSLLVDDERLATTERASAILS